MLSEIHLLSVCDRTGGSNHFRVGTTSLLTERIFIHYNHGESDIMFHIRNELSLDFNLRMRFNVLPCLLSLTKESLGRSCQQIRDYTLILPAHFVVCMKELTPTCILK